MKITLYENGTAFFEKEAFVICGEPLVIEVDSAYDNLYAVCHTEQTHLPIKVKDGVLTIPPSLMIPGEMSITFKQIVNGEVIKVWHSERVTLKGLGEEYEVIPELVTIKMAIKELYKLVRKNNLI
jgi:hypothetical protein